jgi:hypothetical protein
MDHFRENDTVHVPCLDPCTPIFLATKNSTSKTRPYSIFLCWPWKLDDDYLYYEQRGASCFLIIPPLYLSFAKKVRLLNKEKVVVAAAASNWGLYSKFFSGIMCVALSGCVVFVGFTSSSSNSQALELNYSIRFAL